LDFDTHFYADIPDFGLELLGKAPERIFKIKDMCRIAECRTGEQMLQRSGVAAPQATVVAVANAR